MKRKTRKVLLTDAQATKLATLRQQIEEEYPSARRLTHKLEYISDHWSCRCGYVLGTGHDALYAVCPLAEERYIESDITQRAPDRPSKAALDLFDI